MTLKLRDYQEEAIVNIEASFKEGRSSPCLVLPTGAGKTGTGLTYLDRHEPGKLLWMAPRVSLIDQTWRAVAKFAPSLKERLTIATVQSLMASRSRLPEVDLCVVDEAHFFYGTDEWASIAHAFPRRLAFTATPTRADYKPLVELCDDLLVGPQRRALTAAGYLPPMRTVTCEKKRATAAWKVVDAYQEQCPGERCIVFCADVAHAREVRDNFVAAGIKAGSVSVESASDLALHAAGFLDVLTNVFMVSVGYDDPTVSAVIMARPFSSPTSYIQACGRARGANAEEVKIIDLFGSCHEWGFADEDREFHLDGPPIRLKKEDKEKPIVTCRSCKTAYRLNIHDLRCPCCEGKERTKTKKERNREALLSKYASDTEGARFAFLSKSWAIVCAKKLPRWIPMAQYKKRYGERPPVEWLEKLGMRTTI